MRILALDYGERRIGLALSDPTGTFGGPQPAVEVAPDDAHIGELARFCEQHNVERLVISLPLHMSGEPGASAAAARELGDRLARRTGLPVEYYDERLSTVEAERTLVAGDVSRARRKLIVDSLAAVVLLNAYLNRNNQCTDNESPVE